MLPRLLILETSCQVGQVAVARGEQVLSLRRLDEARRHARDLAPAMRELLDEQRWHARELDAIIVSRGPGSYTGLRVGLMTAKTLAYATGARLAAIDTFAAIARQTPAEAGVVDVVADAQQKKLYVQRFTHSPSSSSDWKAASPLRIETLAQWEGALAADVWISGPGVFIHEQTLQRHPLVEAGWRFPSVESLLHLGLERFQRGERDDFWSLEPLYLRASAAEEKWAQMGRK